MGRSALIMVLGFTTAVMMIGSNISRVSNAAMENYTYYNNFLNVAGTPVFMQRATSLNGINNYQGQAHPVFKGGMTAE